MDLDSIKSQFRNLPILLSPSDCKGKTYIVTGANIGLGLECARHLACLGSAKVILAVRSLEKGQAAAANISASVPPEQQKETAVEVWQLDMSSYASIKSFAGRVSRELDRVDAVVANAAAAEGKWTVADSGWENTLAVNFFGTFLLVVLLIPVLGEMGKKLCTTPRIVVVTSALAWARKGDLDRMKKGKDVLKGLNDKGTWGIEGTGRYALSKLIQIFALRRLTELAPVASTGVIVNMINPGLCKTGLDRHVSTSTKVYVHILRAAIGQTAEQGSRCLIYGIAAGTESHGQFLSYCHMKDTDVPDWVKDEGGRKWSEIFWEGVAEELEKAESGCTAKALKRQ